MDRDFHYGAYHNHPQIEMVRISELRPYPNNPRRHNRRQRRALEANIRRFGFVVPILIDADRAIVAGALRVEVAAALGYEEVPAIRITHLNEAEIRAFIIADNRIAELGDWDEARLAVEFEFLHSVDFDLDLIGFEPPEIDLVMMQAADAETDSADLVPEMDDDAPTVSRVGDLWLLGKHRLLCGDALDSVAWDRLMAGKKAQVIFTDPPYNVPIDHHVSGLGRIRHREFVMASGEMTPPEFTEFLLRAFTNMARFSADGSIHYVCMDWRHLKEVLEAGAQAYTEFKNLCVWVKDNGGMGSLYRSRHELVLVFKQGHAAHINNVELGRHGRNRTNVWEYPGVNGFSPDRQAELATHPTVKPVAMVADAMLDCSPRGAIVADPFVGSGTLFIGAEKAGRRGYGIELDTRYVDVAIRRWEAYTGTRARHAETGLTFAETAASRLSGPSLPKTDPEARS